MLFISEMKSLSLLSNDIMDIDIDYRIIKLLDIHAWTFASIWAINSGYDGI